MGKVVSPLRAQKCPKKKYRTGAAAANATNASNQRTCAMMSQTSFSAELRMSIVTDSPDCSFMVSLRVCARVEVREAQRFSHDCCAINIHRGASNTPPRPQTPASQQSPTSRIPATPRAGRPPRLARKSLLFPCVQLTPSKFFPLNVVCSIIYKKAFVNGTAYMTFKKATDCLFSRIDHSDLAKALGISVASIRQARLRSDSLAHRSPPADWENALIRFAEERVRHFRRLIEEI